MAKRTKKGPKQVETLTHDEAKRKSIPTAELQSAAQRIEEINPIEPVTYPREDPLPEGETRPRDEDLDPQIIWKGATLRLRPDEIAQLTETGRLEIGDAQLVWRGKDQQDWADLVVQAPPLYIQEKIHPKAIIEDLKRQTKERQEAAADIPDLFADFNGIEPGAKTEFYQHDQNWQNRMILGDSLQVMASLAEREGLRGQVQCIYFDPPYGIKFNSNWQVSTRSRDVKDGKLDQITREPEQVKAFRDTWKDGIHSYLTYIRDRLTAMRDLLTESGSIYLQIGDENVHRVRSIMDEIFGDENFWSQISYKTSVGLGSRGLDNTANFILWYCKSRDNIKFRPPLKKTTPGESGASRYKTVKLPNLLEYREPDPANAQLSDGARLFRDQGLTSRTGSSTTVFAVKFQGNVYKPSSGGWRTSATGMERAVRADRIIKTGRSISYRKYYDDFPAISLDNVWSDVSGGGNKSRRP